MSGLKLKDVAELGDDELRRHWLADYGADAPQLALAHMRGGLAYAVQARKYGALVKRVDGLVASLSDAALVPPVVERRQHRLTTGTQLVRNWHGTTHRVVVRDDGYEYAGTTWSSLSAIAQAITGTAWSGPRFFGLTAKRQGRP